MPTPTDVEHFAAQGFLVTPQLFDSAEVVHYRDHFMELRKEPRPGDDAGVNPTSDDPLRKYPRMIHMHRWDKTSFDWMIEPRIANWLTALLGGLEPFAVQTMLYFKPAGARGQALHQDNYYLRVQPGTCIAAWLALDDCDVENGCIQVVPASHAWDILCSIPADTTQSFSAVTVPIPKTANVAPIEMRAGDVMFFNGQIVHGSYPNTSATRFRRALIGHYIHGESQQVGRWYHPVLRMDGSQVELEQSPGSTQCGVWVDGAEGAPAIAVTGIEKVDMGVHD